MGPPDCQPHGTTRRLTTESGGRRPKAVQRGLSTTGRVRRREAAMSFRELTMTDVKEVLRRWTAGQSVRQMARESGVDRKTVRRYIEAAKGVGLTLASPLDDGALEEI